MNSQTKEIIVLLLVLFGMILVGSLVLIGFSIAFNNIDEEADCKKMDGYGYKAQLRELNLGVKECVVQTKSGKWIRSSDFNIASVEEFKRT